MLKFSGLCFSRSVFQIFESAVVSNAPITRLLHDSTKERCNLLILGGGAGGCSIAAKFARLLGKESVLILEPSDVHYYQPMLTLVGAGIKKVKDCERPMKKVLPSGVHWVQDAVSRFEVENNTVHLKNGGKISYNYMLVAIGLTLRFDLVKGLEEALKDPSSCVCTNYSPLYAEKTFAVLQSVESGNAVFTFPNTPVKCAGAPQKACYLSEDYLRRNGKRDKVEVHYKTSLPAIFSVTHYATSLLNLCDKRGIKVGYKQELTEIDICKKEAVFQTIGKPEEKSSIQYSMLHVTPPMSAPSVLKTGKSFTDINGYLDVDKLTLQHKTYSNVFGIGDCTNLPTSKTAAAVAAQGKVVFNNMVHTMKGEELTEEYNGYSSCPLVTGYDTCILAEFDYNLQPLETFPIDQSKESKLMFFMKKDVMPHLYWVAMMNGYWNGPQAFRKYLNFGVKK